MISSTKIALLVVGVALNVVARADIVSATQDNRLPVDLKTPTFDRHAACTTPQCLALANEILSDINSKVDPCQDFNHFACGGFIEKREIPVDQATTDYFNILINRNNQIIRELVGPSVGKPPPYATSETEEDKVASQANLQKLQDLYFSCMDEDALLVAGRQPLLDLLQSIFTLFPLATTTTTTADSKTILSKTLAGLFNQGLAGLIDVAVIADPTNPLAHSLQVKESKLGLPSKEYYQDVQTVLTYESIIAQMFHIVLGEEDVALRSQPFTDADVAQEWNAAAKDIVDLETQLAAIGTELFDQFDPVKSNNPRTIVQLSALVPSVDWTLLFAETLYPDATNALPVIVQSTAYLSQLQTVLQAATLKTLRLYFTWVAIKDLGPNLGLPYRRPLQVLNAVIAGTAPELQPPRWKDCVAAINTNLGDMAGYFFIQEFFKGNSRQSVVSIIDSLLQTYAEIFPTLPWLDEPTRTGALQKVQSIQKLIGYSTDSPNVASPTSLLSYYFNLTISKSDHFGNQHRYAVWSKALERSQLNESVNQKQMEESPQTVDAFYHGPTNRINFPAGILQPPFFHVNNPEYLNYGAMGVAAGHEITHGFDNMGRNYDSAGRVKNWWTNMTEKAFNEKAQCFLDQYGNYTIKGPDGKDYRVNGQLTLGENIADNGGLKHAYRTWQIRYQSDPSGIIYKNFKLPGLENYTLDQLFFISFGRIWCSKERPEYLVQLIRGNSHPPWRWRTMGSVQNSHEFARAFGCPSGSPMNPDRKCEVW